MTPLAWTATIVGTLLGLLVGYILGRIRFLYVFGTTISYNCSSRTLTVPFTNTSGLNRVYAVVTSGAAAPSDTPPASAQSTDTISSSVSITGPSTGSAPWPNSGKVSWVVWGASFTQTSASNQSCSTGSGSSIAIKELEGRPALRITVPDGPLKGAYTATSTGPMRWQATIGSGSYTIACESPDALTVQSPSAKASTRTGCHRAVFGHVPGGTVPGGRGRGGDERMSTLRPCFCDRFHPGRPFYEGRDCPHCWMFAHRPEVRKAWGGDPADCLSLYAANPALPPSTWPTCSMARRVHCRLVGGNGRSTRQAHLLLADRFLRKMPPYPEGRFSGAARSSAAEGLTRPAFTSPAGC